MTATLKAIKAVCEGAGITSIPEQGKWLRRVVQGYPEPHLPNNFPTMQEVAGHTTNLWRRALRRSSQKDDTRPLRKQTNWHAAGYQHLD
jgi:hypothetical protein